MLPYSFYKLVHVLGFSLALVSLGGLTVHALNGGRKQENGARKLLISMHGAGALLVLVGGFGLLARIGFAHGGGFPLWLWVKLALWAVLAAVVILPDRAPQATRPILIALPLLAMAAAAMAVYKPT